MTLSLGTIFQYVPGLPFIAIIVILVASTGVRHLDVAIVSYLFQKNIDPRRGGAWKLITEAIVLYGRNWLGIVKISTYAVLFNYLAQLIIFSSTFSLLLIILLLLPETATHLSVFYEVVAAIVGALLLTFVCKKIFIEPIIMIAILRNYILNIQDI